MVSLSEPVPETTTSAGVNPVDVPDMDVLFKLNMIVSVLIIEKCRMLFQQDFEDFSNFLFSSS